MTTTAPTVEVTVKHIPLTKETYNELLSGLDELDEAYGKTAQTANSRRWMHYQWYLAQIEQAKAQANGT
jgi:hypothetical protein